MNIKMNCVQLFLITVGHKNITILHCDNILHYSNGYSSTPIFIRDKIWYYFPSFIFIYSRKGLNSLKRINWCLYCDYF